MSKHTPGPWQWYFRSPQSGYELVHPHKGYLLVMDFTRLGMRGGQPRFATWQGEERGNMGGVMRKAEELVPLDQHPDARLIAAAPDMLTALQNAPLPSLSKGTGEHIERFYQWFEHTAKPAIAKATA